MTTHESVVSPSDDRITLSLLSLSIAAENASPIPVPEPPVPESPSTIGNESLPSAGIVLNSPTALKHRRLSSTGRARRRLSDARDAANRPSPAVIQSAAATLSSLASLSLSSSLPQQSSLSSNAGLSRSVEDVREEMLSLQTSNVKPIAIDGSGGKSGKKRGTVFTCESCSKVYRHPSCLIKHRWEHSPHWKEASKFVLSKHQQVQLLEAAAILSHMSPTSGTSLPEDRSLWPAFLAGGLSSSISTASTVNEASATAQPLAASVPSNVFASARSTSVPHSGSALSSRARSTGPRLHDYALPASATVKGGITELRPGVLAIPTGPDSASPSDTLSDMIDPDVEPPRKPSEPVPVPAVSNAMKPNVDFYRFAAQDAPDAWAFQSSSLRSKSYSYADNLSGWSLPRSSVRSVSSYSRSRSTSRSDESEPVDVADAYHDGSRAQYAFGSRGRASTFRYDGKAEDDDMSLGYSVPEEEEEVNVKDEEWDGMEMEMEMD